MQKTTEAWWAVRVARRRAGEVRAAGGTARSVAPTAKAAKISTTDGSKEAGASSGMVSDAVMSSSNNKKGGGGGGGLRGDTFGCEFTETPTLAEAADVGEGGRVWDKDQGAVGGGRARGQDGIGGVRDGMGVGRMGGGSYGGGVTEKRQG